MYICSELNMTTMNPTKVNDVLDLTKQGISTFYYIGQMARYRYQYTLGKELQDNHIIQVNACDLAQNRDEMIKYACLAGLGALRLLTIGVSGLSSWKR